MTEKLQVSLFDVSDLAQPTLAGRIELPLPRWAQTEGTDDHHAAAYYPEHQVLALPVTNRGRTKLWVVGVDLATKDNQTAAIEVLGQVEHDARVRRSVRIADDLYSISEDWLTVHPIREPEREVARLSLLHQVGDANGDGRFGPRDIVQVLRAAKYLTSGAAGWSEGDWNGDGVFDTLDVVLALQLGHFQPLEKVRGSVVRDYLVASTSRLLPNRGVFVSARPRST